jgi:hypothetical protein
VRSGTLAGEGRSMGEDFEQQEYFAVQAAISDFDQRLLTIKGWGVTLSLAALGFGFQYRSYGLFLVSAASSLSFWAVEAVTKRHQMRHYLRAREIEVHHYAVAAAEGKKYSVPRISWSWEQAQNIYNGADPDSMTKVKPVGVFRWYRFSFVLPHVMLPHAITLAVSVALFFLGLHGMLSGFSLGAVVKS